MGFMHSEMILASKESFCQANISSRSQTFIFRSKTAPAGVIFHGILQVSLPS